MDNLKSALSNCRSKWQALPVASRAATLIAICISAFSVAWLLVPHGPELQPIFNSRQFTQSELNTMTQVFAENGLNQWEIKDQCMCVPLDQRANYIAALSGSFEPNATTSSVDTVLEKNSIWDSPSTRNLRLQNAREKDLARVIALMPDIEEARVNIDQHDDKRFGSKNRMTALVAVSPAPTHQIEPDRVLAIREIVAAGYAGLEHQNITVIDLGTGQVSGSTGALHTKASMNARLKDHEIQWRNKLEQLLAAIPGLKIQVSIQAHRASHSSRSKPTDEEPFAGYDIIARSSINVPSTFFDRLLAQQYPMLVSAQADSTEKADKLDEIESKVISNIKQLTTGMTPHMPGADSVNSKVNVAAVTVAKSEVNSDHDDTATASTHPTLVLVLLGITALALTFVSLHQRRDAKSQESTYVPEESSISQLQEEPQTTSTSDVQEQHDEHSEIALSDRDKSAYSDNSVTDETEHKPLENAKTPESVDGDHSDLVSKLGNLPAAAVADSLKREQISTIAVVLAELQEQDAGPIWACLPSNLREEVMQSIRSGVHRSGEVFNTIAQAIITEVDNLEESSLGLAERIANAGQATFAHRLQEENALSGIDLLSGDLDSADVMSSESDSQDSESFDSFDAWLEGSDTELGSSLENCNVATIATALFGTTVETQQRVLHLLDTQRSLELECALLKQAPVRIGDIDKCRQRIIRKAAA